MNENKKCPSCKENKALSDFPKAKTPNHSIQRYLKKCKLCTNLHTHDLTYVQYLQFCQIQNHKCPICDLNLSEIKINIDHDHLSGKVRGLLCGGCNVSLGTIERNITNIDDQLKILDRQRNRLIKTSNYLINPPCKSMAISYLASKQ